MRSDTLHRNQFTFYRSFRDALQNLPKAQRIQVMEALMDYALDGILPTDLHGSGAAVFALLQPVVDSSRTKAINRSKPDESEPYHYAEWDRVQERSVPDNVRDKRENKKENKKKIDTEEEREKEGSAARSGESPALPKKNIYDFSHRPISPFWHDVTRGIPGLSAAVRDYLAENEARGRPFSAAEEACLAQQLAAVPEWERLSTVERAAEEQRRSFLQAGASDGRGAAGSPEAARQRAAAGTTTEQPQRGADDRQSKEKLPHRTNFGGSSRTPPPAAQTPVVDCRAG